MNLIRQIIICLCAIPSLLICAEAQEIMEPEYGPVVRAYLEYLDQEENVVDDRISRPEINRAYYRRNSNRIRALRKVVMKMAEENGDDYIPELQAVTQDELGMLFEDPPKPNELSPGKVLDHTYRFLGTSRSVELFYIFVRLDDYDIAEIRQMSDVKYAVTRK